MLSLRSRSKRLAGAVQDQIPAESLQWLPPEALGSITRVERQKTAATNTPQRNPDPTEPHPAPPEPGPTEPGQNLSNDADTAPSDRRCCGRTSGDESPHEGDVIPRPYCDYGTKSCLSGPACAARPRRGRPAWWNERQVPSGHSARGPAPRYQQDPPSAGRPRQCCGQRLAERLEPLPNASPTSQATK